MRDGYWVIRTYESGSIGEKTKFWVQGDRNRRNSRREKSEIRKQEQNEYAAEKRLARLINANFGAGDLLLGLDYSEAGHLKLEPESETDEAEAMNIIRENAEKQLRLCLRRVKYALEKKGIEFRYIAVTSDMDGDTGESVRVHHHLIVPAEAREVFLEKWTLGGVDWTVMRRQADYLPIAEYLLRQVRRVPDARKYMRSRNLIQPVPKDRVAVTASEIRVPKGAELLQRNAFKPGQSQYVRYILPQCVAAFKKP